MKRGVSLSNFIVKHSAIALLAIVGCVGLLGAPRAGFATSDATAAPNGSDSAIATDNDRSNDAATSIDAVTADDQGEKLNGSTGNWVTGYYASWQTHLYPINRIDFTALTHIVLAHWLTNSNGTVQTSDWDTSASTIVPRAHTAGVKVIMMLGGSDDVNFSSAANPTHRATLVNTILSRVNSLALDGVDLDWEVNINNSNFVALARALRQAAPELIITVPLDPSVGTAPLAASLAPYVDQINMMDYGEANTSEGWVSWYFSALAGDGSDHPASIALWAGSFISRGVPASKIGVGIGFFASGWTAPVTGALHQIGNATVPLRELPYGTSTANGGGVLSWFYNKSSSTYVWSGTQTGDKPAAQQPSISIPHGTTPNGWTGPPITWVTYEDEASVAAKAAYIKANNLGGAMIWTLGEGATDPSTGRNPLLDSLKLHLLNRGPAAMPLLGSTEGYVSGPMTVVVSGLPSNLSKIVVTWWNGNTGFDERFSSWGSYGRPSEYYIDASKDGSHWTPLTHVTGNEYSGRQFFYDFSGTGYMQVRLRVLSIMGSNAGNVVVTVHRANNGAADTYLLLGDSITSNCWAANAFPVEELGTLIHAHRSGRFPVVQEAGIPAQTSGSVLSTTTYGEPAIRRWLHDFPTVKYVGLSYGMNDANGGIPPATYYANMKKLVQEVIAAGKVPVIPTIVASPAANVQANAPAMNAYLIQLKHQYPSMITGPNLWTLFYGHSVSDGWFLDNLHPSLGIGCRALQNAWASRMIFVLYPQ